jgi:hypothetical protein
MALLEALPTETLILILQYLGAIDLQSVLHAQRVSRRFRGVIQDAVLHSSSHSHHSPEGGVKEVGIINPLLQTKFKGLFNSADCFTASERARFMVLTLNGDFTLPFRRLPWADPVTQSRDTFLRPEASWRGLSPTFGTSPPILSLDIVKTFEAETDTGSGVLYSQIELPSSGLSMGLLYDILMCEETLYGSRTGSWELLVGKNLRSFDVLYRWGCFIIDQPGESQLVRETPDAAILYVRGGEGCRETGLDEREWTPRRLGSARPRFMPWQGPLIDPEETEWFR